MYSKEQERGKGREKERCVSLIGYFPHGCNDQVWANPKQEGRSFWQVFHMDAGTQVLRPPSANFPDTLSWSWTGSGTANI